jgi:hypothetical protein
MSVELSPTSVYIWLNLAWFQGPNKGKPVVRQRKEKDFDGERGASRPTYGWAEVGGPSNLAV